MGKKGEKENKSILRTQLCSFSGYKMVVGRGKMFVHLNGKKRIFLNSKCEAKYKQNKHPREVKWTVLYRHFHKKTKPAKVDDGGRPRFTRQNQKFQRGIVGCPQEKITALRNMKPEIRQEAIRAAKEKARLRQCGKGSNSTSKTIEATTSNTKKANSRKKACESLPVRPRKSRVKNRSSV